MKLKKAKITNFRSIINTEFDLEDDMTLLLGKNEQGKTNVLKALESFSRNYNYSEEDLCYLNNDVFYDNNIPMVTLTFRLDEVDLDAFDLEYDINELTITKYYSGNYVIENDLQRIGNAESVHIKNKLENCKRYFENYATLLINKLEKNKLINYILSHHNEDGGFCNQYNEKSNMVHTYYAIKMLKNLGVNDFNTEKIVKFVQSCENSSGGFCVNNNEKNKPNIQATNKAIMTLYELDSLDRIVVDNHINWIKQLQNTDGGLGNQPGAESNIMHTYLGIEILFVLGYIKEIDNNDVIDFIKSLENSNGGFHPNKKSNNTTIEAFWSAVNLYHNLNCIERIYSELHINWLKNSQNNDGSFGNIVHAKLVTDCVLYLEYFNKIDLQGLIKFVLSLQNENGGFVEQSGKNFNMAATFNGVTILSKLDQFFTNILENANEKSLNENCYYFMNNYLKFIDNEKEGVIDELLSCLKNIHNNDCDNLHAYVTSKMTNFIYFSDVDYIEDIVNLSNLLNDESRYKTMLNLLYLTNVDITRLKNMQNKHFKNRYVQNRSATISGKINDAWEQEDVEVNIGIDGDDILIKIEDSAGACADEPSKRSEGFKWFLSFYINFMAGTEKEFKNSIILLDNPGVVLHPSGQKNLLNTMEEISNDNQIIIATHSPFLINKNKMERVRIVERANNGTQVYEKLWNTNKDSFQAIRTSLGMHLSDSLFGSENNLIVEGFSDKIYIESMVEYLINNNINYINLDNLTILGAGNADKIRYYLIIFKAEKYNCLAVFDNDEEGKESLKKIQNENVDVGKDEILKIDEVCEYLKGKAVEMENLIDEDAYIKAVNEAYKKIYDGFVVERHQLVSKSKRTKKFDEYFRENGLGKFDKMKVAFQFKNMITSGEFSSDDLSNTINNFDNFINLVKKKMKLG